MSLTRCVDGDYIVWLRNEGVGRHSVCVAGQCTVQLVVIQGILGLVVPDPISLCDKLPTDIDVRTHEPVDMIVATL
eukprot:scaffold4849_cov202-Prasinococcus_capsulatus_cf.AAC.1